MEAAVGEAAVERAAVVGEAAVEKTVDEQDTGMTVCSQLEADRRRIDRFVQGEADSVVVGFHCGLDVTYLSSEALRDTLACWHRLEQFQRMVADVLVLMVLVPVNTVGCLG